MHQFNALIDRLEATDFKHKNMFVHPMLKYTKVFDFSNCLAISV